MTKNLNWIFVSKQERKIFKHSAKQSFEILNFSEETKSWVQVFEKLSHMLEL